MFPLETQQNPKQNPNINQCKCNYCNRPSSEPEGLNKFIDSPLQFIWEARTPSLPSEHWPRIELLGGGAGLGLPHGHCELCPFVTRGLERFMVLPEDRCPPAAPVLHAMSHVVVAGTPAVIFDNGSGQCKAGLSGELAPRSVISTVVGYPKFRLVMFGAGHKEWYVGEEAQSKRGILSLNYPMDNGLVTSWDNMEKIWRYLYEQELRLKPSERPALLTETPLNPLSHREKMAELMFESFHVPALFVTLQALAVLYSGARTTGLVLDSGDGVTVTVPVYKGKYLLQGITRVDFAGRDVTKYLARLLLETGHSFMSATEREIVRDIKEKLCYVALDPRQKMQDKPENLSREYILPDGRSVTVGDQLFRAPEALFAPREVEAQGPGVVGMVLRSLARCSSRIQLDILRNVVLSGGSTLFQGFKERLLKDLQAAIPSIAPVKIFSPENRMYSVWTGASLLASLTAFRNMWITREDYYEVGPTLLQRKCF